MSIRRGLALVLILLWGATAWAQEPPNEAQEAWQALAARAEATAEAGVASTFALTRLREELFVWRDTFLQDQEINAGRISTVEAQIAALGPLPDTGEELPTIATRRAALELDHARLSVPARLAAESHARANGLISEIDRLIRLRDAETLSERGPSPLNPVYWGDGLGAVSSGVATLGLSITQRLEAQWTSGRLLANLPVAVLALAVALLALLRGRRMATQAQSRIANSAGRLPILGGAVVSLGQIVLPAIGLVGVLYALSQFDLLNLPGANLPRAVFWAGMAILVSRWITTQMFPSSTRRGPLGYDAPTARSLRRLGAGMGTVLAIWLVLDELVTVSDPTDIARDVAIGPVLAVLAWLLFRTGQVMRSPPQDTALPTSTGGRGRSVLGRVAMLVAVAAPVLAVLGYGVAAKAILLPFVLTLAVLCFVMLLQRLVVDLYVPGGSPDSEGPLMPVLISFALFAVAVPFLALIWGARYADLREVWARFREGVALGDVRISPTDLITFLLVFGVIYMLTRFLQGALRKSVLPRTRLDLGAQNAIISGLGYVGIFLAGLLAITSAGIDLSNLALVAGALSLGIGFGLQNIVQNFVSGIILLIERPIGEGDMIEVNDQIGYVRDISVRSTRIETFDRRDVIIPNADLVSGQVTNWTRGNAVGRLVLPVGVAYGTDIDLVKSILNDVAQSHPMVLIDPPPGVFFRTFGASSLDFEIRAILRDVNWKLVVASEMNEQINARFTAAGIEIPFAQTDLWLRNPETLTPKNEADE